MNEQLCPIKVTIRTTTGDHIVEAFHYTKVANLKNRLKAQKIMPNDDYSLVMVTAGQGNELADDKSLAESGVKDGFVIIMEPNPSAI